MPRQSIARLNVTPARIGCHAGLWLDKMPPADALSSETAGKHVRVLESLPVPMDYALAIETRRRAWSGLADEGRASVFEASARGRVIVGLGAKNALEFGITLDHTWGMPYLPGSALKGLAASAAHLLTEGDQWRKGLEWPAWRAGDAPTDFQLLFGATDRQGMVTFHDAWWIPKGNEGPFAADVMTVHHPRYYQAEPASLSIDDVGTIPTDFDEPTPIPFVSVHGTFLVVLESDERDEDGSWREAAAKLLERGLRELGIGAKTSSGYGRLTLDEQVTDRQRAHRDRVEAIHNALRSWRGAQTRGAVVDAIARHLEAGGDSSDLEPVRAKLERDDRRAIVDALRRRLAPELHAAAEYLVEAPAAARATVPAAPGPQEAPRAEPVWQRKQAYAARDKKNRVEVFIDRPSGTDIGKLAEKPSEELKHRLLAASREAPIEVEAYFEGAKLKGIREPR